MVSSFYSFVVYYFGVVVIIISFSSNKGSSMLQLLYLIGEATLLECSVSTNFGSTNFFSTMFILFMNSTFIYCNITQKVSLKFRFGSSHASSTCCSSIISNTLIFYLGWGPSSLSLSIFAPNYSSLGIGSLSIETSSC